MAHRILAVSTLLLSSLAFGDFHVPGKGDLESYEIHAYSYQSGYFSGTLEIKKARMSRMTGRPIPWDTGTPEEFTRYSNPERFWTTTRVTLYGCAIEGEGWKGFIEGDKTDDHYASGTTLLDPDDPTKILDAFYCDNNQLFLIDGDQVVDSLSLNEGYSHPLSMRQPAFIFSAVQFDGVLYAARANQVRLIQVSGKQLRPIAKSYRQNSLANETLESVLAQNHVQDYEYYDRDLYTEDRYKPYQSGVNKQNGLAVHFDQRGQPFLFVQQDNRFRQQFRGTPSDPNFFQTQLDESSGYLTGVGEFEKAAANTHLLNHLVVKDKDKKKDDRGMGRVRATIHGARPMEGDITGMTSNHLYKFHLNLLGRNDTFFDYAFFRAHHGHPVSLSHPAGIPEGVTVYDSEPTVRIITGMKQRAGSEFQHFDVETGFMSAPMTNVSSGGVKVTTPLLFYTEGLIYAREDYRRRQDKPEKFKKRGAMDIKAMDHLGRTLVFEFGSDRGDTDAPEGLEAGFEIYAIAPLMETLKKQPVTGNGAYPDQGPADSRLFMRIKPSAGKGYFDGVGISPVITNHYQTTEQ